MFRSFFDEFIVVVEVVIHSLSHVVVVAPVSAVAPSVLVLVVVALVAVLVVSMEY